MAKIRVVPASEVTSASLRAEDYVNNKGIVITPNSTPEQRVEMLLEHLDSITLQRLADKLKEKQREESAAQKEKEDKAKEDFIKWCKPVLKPLVKSVKKTVSVNMVCEIYYDTFDLGDMAEVSINVQKVNAAARGALKKEVAALTKMAHEIIKACQAEGERRGLLEMPTHDAMCEAWQELGGG
jgi:HSP90 family molecular chaperone